MLNPQKISILKFLTQGDINLSSWHGMTHMLVFFWSRSIHSVIETKHGLRIVLHSFILHRYFQLIGWKLFWFIWPKVIWRNAIHRTIFYQTPQSCKMWQKVQKKVTTHAWKNESKFHTWCHILQLWHQKYKCFHDI
jgi:hypothetical protein